MDCVSDKEIGPALFCILYVQEINHRICALPSALIFLSADQDVGKDGPGGILVEANAALLFYVDGEVGGTNEQSKNRYCLC